MFARYAITLQIVSVGMRESKISHIMEGCVAKHGYFYMSQAEARADKLATTTKKKHVVHTAMN